MNNKQLYRTFMCKTDSGLVFVDVSNLTQIPCKKFVEEVTERLPFFIKWVGDWRELNDQQ